MSEKNGQAMIQIPTIGLNIDVENIDEIIEKLEKVNELSSKVTHLVPMDDYLLKISDVASVLGVNTGTVGKLVKSGHLKALKIGCMKVRKKELERFMIHVESTGFSLDDICWSEEKWKEL